MKAIKSHFRVERTGLHDFDSLLLSSILETGRTKIVSSFPASLVLVRKTVPGTERPEATTNVTALVSSRGPGFKSRARRVFSTVKFPF